MNGRWNFIGNRFINRIFRSPMRTFFVVDQLCKQPLCSRLDGVCTERNDGGSFENEVNNRS